MGSAPFTNRRIFNRNFGTRNDCALAIANGTGDTAGVLSLGEDSNLAENDKEDERDGCWIARIVLS
jgi:hypothetical protein